MLLRRVAPLLLLASCLSALPVGAQDSLEEARARREAIQEEAASTAAEIDVLAAEDAEIVAALEEIERWISMQEAQLAHAEQRLAAAIDDEHQARQIADELAEEVAQLRASIADQSVNSYIGEFTADDALLLDAEDINSVPVLRFVLDESTGVSEAATDLLRSAQATQDDAIARAEEAAADARRLTDDISHRLDELEESRRAQRRLGDEIDRRITDLERTAAVLEAEDAEIEQFIQAELARIAAEEEARRRAEEEARRRAEEEARRAEADRAAGAQDADQDATTGPGDDVDASEEREGATGDATPGAEAADRDPEPDEAAPADDDAVTQDGAPRFVRPVSGAIVSGFGTRIHPVYGTERFHAGLDFNAPHGAAIGSASAGTVIFVGPFAGYGNTVIVGHSGGYSSLYAHMSGFNTSTGAQVASGETIGFVGSTGLSTGPHLHFEIRLDGGAIDPRPFL